MFTSLVVDPPVIAEGCFDVDADAMFGDTLVTWLPSGNAHFSNTPVIVTDAYLAQLQRVCSALHRALQAIVARYFHDSRIRAIYALPPALEGVLRVADGRPYRVGFYRPDLVFDRGGQPRICEVGARYPLNGWMLSEVSQRVFAPAPAYAAFRLQAQLSAFWSTLRALHPPGSTVVLVHGREPGSEIFQLRDDLRQRGVRFLQAAPESLLLRNGRIVVADAGGERAIDRCILEMDRTELLALAPPVLEHLVVQSEYFNDVRTLILVHDKRTLAVLWDESILSDCVDADDASTLRPWLIPSWVANDAQARKALLARPGNLIAKRNSGGRGVDAVVRSSCGEAAWHELVNNQWSDYMFQDYIAQREYRDPKTGDPMHLIGMALCRDAISYGAGVFRGSNEAIINVHQGRGRLFAAMQRA